MIKESEVYRIGRLGKAHGIKGEVSFQFDDDVFDRVDADYLVLDIDGITGGFNFQAAWTTAYTVAQSIALTNERNC